MAYCSYNNAGSGIASWCVLCVPHQLYLVEVMLWLHRGRHLFEYGQVVKKVIRHIERDKS